MVICLLLEGVGEHDILDSVYPLVGHSQRRTDDREGSCDCEVTTRGTQKRRTLYYYVARKISGDA